jgi:phospholipase C
MFKMKTIRILVAHFSLLLALVIQAPPTLGQSESPNGLENLEHIVVIYLENRSFDHLFGQFPGANGLNNAAETLIQVDKNGKPYKTLPPVMDTNEDPSTRDSRFPTRLPNKPFLIDQYIGLDDIDLNPTHRWYQQQQQINGGKMDRFAEVSNVGGFVMGYHDGSKTRLWQYAKDYTLADNFFHAAFGGSFLNHFWMICACTPKFENAPKDIVAKEALDGRMRKDGAVTPDGYAVNTLQSVYHPHSSKIDPALLLPPQTLPTIGDRLDEASITWAWYAGGWNDVLAGKDNRGFQFHHQPFTYFKRYANDSDARHQHLKDEADLVADIEKGTLPSVVFDKPVGEENEHPGYADVISGDEHAANIIEKIQHSPVWSSTAIIVTYDENGGFWDHVPPPKVDRWGPGVRVPTVIISPFSKRSYVDHTLYDTTSILKLIETRYGLAPLSERDAKVNDLIGTLDLSR